MTKGKNKPQRHEGTEVNAAWRPSVSLCLCGSIVLRLAGFPVPRQRAQDRRERLVGKFKKLAVKALPQKQVDALADAVMDMENLKDAGEIAKLLTPA
jgi:hypothetical protein